MKIKTLSQCINEGKEQDESTEAVYLASEIDLLDKTDKNVKAGDPKKDTKEIENKRKELANKYKEITGHEDIKKSIPEAKILEAVQVYESMMDDLGIKNIKEFGQKFATQIKALVADIGGTYIGYFYDTPTKSIAIVTDKGMGKYYYDVESGEFEDYQQQVYYK